MTISLLATACPPVQASSTLVKIADAYSGAVMPPTSQNYIACPADQTIARLNENAMRQDLSARFGGGARAILVGLGLSASALVATVAAGQANIDGIVEISAATTAGLSDNSQNYIWLLQTGVLQNVPNSLTPPATAALYLGRITTTSGTPGTPDTSGVMYMRGPLPFRQTADIGAPGDTPPATAAFIAQTLAGRWLWDGTAYILVGGTPVLTADPGTPYKGQTWYRSDLDKMSIYNGTVIRRSGMYT